MEPAESRPTTDWLLFGLGNPGSRYEQTRHNLGWMLVSRLCEKHGARLIAGRANYFSARVTIEGRRLHLVKPTTYMNLSGGALRAYLSIERPEVPEICVAVDEVEIALGKIRLRPKGSAGGHNGLKSVEAALRTKEYTRLRLGCGPAPEGIDRADFVLGDFPEDEVDAVKLMVAKAAEAIESWVLNGVQSTMGKFNG